MSKYRLLREGEKIQEGDEFLSPDDATTWFERMDIGHIHSAYGFPSRRPLEAPEQKTITVKFAVAVNPTNLHWDSGGWGRDNPAEDEDMMKMALAGIRKNKTALRYWVTAVIPIPEPPVIVGTVTEGEN